MSTAGTELVNHIESVTVVSIHSSTCVVCVCVLQILLQLTKGLFEDTTRLGVVMKKVMQQSLELIPSERCAVLLIDQDDSKEVQQTLHVSIPYIKSLIGANIVV